MARLVLVGLGALAVLFVAAALVTAIAIPPGGALDEKAHISYGYYLTQFDPPTIEDPLIGGPYTYRQDRTVYVANHPPVYHMLIGPVLRGANAVTDPLTAIRLARLISVMFGVAAVLATVGLVSELVPSRPSVWLAAGGIAMTIPEVPHISGLLYNDMAAHAFSLAALWVATRMVRRGVTTSRAVVLAIMAALAAGTRLSALPIAAVAVGLAIAAALGQSGLGRRRALGLAALAPAAMALFAGPFYARNIRLYGDVSGGSALYTLLGRRTRDLGDLVQVPFLRARYEALWTDRQLGGKFPNEWLHALAYALLFVGVALILIAIGRAARHWSGRKQAGDLILAVAVAAIAVAVFAGFAQHVTRGGTPSSRYLMSALWIVALTIGLGLLALPRMAATLTLGFGLALSSVTTVYATDAVWRRPSAHAAADLTDRWREVAQSVGPALTVALLLVLAAIPLGLFVFLRCYLGLRRLAEDRTAPSSVPSGETRTERVGAALG